MPLSNVTVNLGASGLGRRLLSNDGITGFVFYNDTPPSGFSANDAKKVFSLGEAENLGITSDNTAYEVDHYHISEFFRVNPNGSLWIGYFDVPGGAYTFDKVVTMQNDFAKGEIRIFGIYTPLVDFANTAVATLQAQLDLLGAANTPATGYLCQNLQNTADLSTLPDLRTENAPDVRVIIAEDNEGTAAALATAKSYSITAMGSILGALSGASVQQSPANPENFNLLGSEMTVPGYANGQSYREVGETASGAIKDKGFTIIRDYLPGISGTYVERIPACVPSSNDYAFQENRRTVQKVQRLMVGAYQPKLNSNVLLSADGELSDFAVEALQDIGQVQIEGMQALGEISDGIVKIDPAQDILATSELVITVDVIPVGVAEFITININLVPNL